MVRVLCLVALTAVVLCSAFSEIDAAKSHGKDADSVNDSNRKDQPGKPHPKGGSVPLGQEEKKKHPKFRRSRSKMRTAGVIPKCFDAREQWPNCQSIKKIRDQGQCGTCWAVVSASVISDRICIASGQVDQTFVSALHIATCFNQTRTGQQNCDLGENAVPAYKNAALLGYITGGDFSNVVGCEPYPFLPKAAPLNCPTSCTNPSYLPKNPSADIRFDDSYWAHYTDPNDPTALATAVMDMQTEIMTNGPISAEVEIWSDFQSWTAAQGAYREVAAGAVNKTGHALRIIGWCEDQNGVPYWTVANTWGTDYGKEGIFWVERGRNVVGIEHAFSAPIVRMDQSCPTSACMTGVDQVIRLDTRDMNSPIYAFQGNCTVRVTVDATTGKMTPVGKPTPIGKVFLNAPSGPIVGYQSNNSTKFLLMNPTFSGVCYVVSGSTKYTCNFEPQTLGATPRTLLNGLTYEYDMATYPTYLIYYDATGAGQGSDIGTAITSQYSKVNALLGLSSGKILICGLSTAGSPVCGTITVTGQDAVVSTAVPIGSSFTQC